MTNIVIIIRRPDYGGEDKRRPRVILAGERSDNYKSCKSSETTDVRSDANDNLRPKLLISKQAIVNLGEEYLPKASDLGWTGYVCARLNCQQLQLFSFSCKSIPKFNFGRALIYFKPYEAFERAELRPLQSEGAKVAGFEDLLSWNCTVVPVPLD
ncbi:unnamed protein product [Prunus armeniaca]